MHTQGQAIRVKREEVIPKTNLYDSVGMTAEEIVSLLEKGDRLSKGLIVPMLGLTKEQAERAIGLGMDKNILQELDRQALNAHRIISLLEANTPLNSYIHEIVQGYYAYPKSKKIEFRDFSAEIDALTREIFTPEVLGSDISFSTPFYGDEEKIDTYNILLGLLHSWYILGKDHPKFGRLFPTVTDPSRTVPRVYLDIWKKYTYTLSDANIPKPYYELPMVEEETGCIRAGVISEGQLSLDELPNTFSSVTLIPQKIGAVADSRLTEFARNIYIVGGATRKLKIHAKILRAFLQEHRSYFLEEPGRCPWQQGHIILKQLVESGDSNMAIDERGNTNKKVRAKKGSNMNHQAQLSSIQNRTQLSNTSKEDTSMQKFDAPKILDTFAMKMREGQAAQEFSIKDICDDIPDCVFLCIGEYIAGALIWHTSKYTRDDIVQFDPINPGKSKQFVFCLATVDQLPSLRLEHTKITVIRPKERKKVTAGDTGGNGGNQDNKGDNPPDQNTNIPSTNEPGNDQLEQEVSMEMSPTDKFALSLIDSIDTLLIQRISAGVIMINLPGRDDIKLEFNVESGTISTKKSPEGVDMNVVTLLVGDDLKTRIDNFLLIEAQNKKVETLSQIHFAYAFLRANLASIGDISKLNLKEEGSFLMTRMKNESGALQLLSSGYSSFLNRFKEVCLQEYGIYLVVAQEQKTQEVNITLSIKGSNGISGSIISTDKDPYYRLSDMTALDEDIGIELGVILKNILFFLGSAGIALKLTTRISTQGGYAMDSDGLKSVYQRSFRTENDPVIGQDSQKSDSERARDIYVKIISGGGVKICSDVQIHSVNVPGTNNKEQIPVYTISSLRNGNAVKLLKYAPDTTKILYRDECLAFMSTGSGHANIYNRIRISERLQKYLTVRMVQAIDPEIIHDTILDPIPEKSRKYIIQAWENIDKKTQQEFLSCFTTEEKDGKVTRSLSIKDAVGKYVFDILLDALAENGVKIIHHSPGWITLAKIREHVQSIRMI